MHRFRRRLSTTAATLAIVVGGLVVSASPAAALPSCNETIRFRLSNGLSTQIPSYRGAWNGCVLGRGNQGTAVAWLQHHIDSCYNIPLSIDGVYGPRTADAVRAVQKRVGVSQDGVFGPRTASAMIWNFGIEETDSGWLYYCVNLITQR